MRDLLLIINLLAFLVLQVYFLIRLVNKTNYDLSNFISSLLNEDSTQVFKSRIPGKSFNNLYKSFNQINKKVSDIKINLANQNQYFRTLAEHVEIGILSFDTKTGKIELFNKTAKRLFNIQHVSNIKNLNRIQEGFAQKITDLKPTKQVVIKVEINDEILLLAIRSSEIKILEKQLKLISFQNIKNELDEKELDSWQKLIRVLTHEMMNSIGPISSTIKTILDFLVDESNKLPKSANNLNNEIINDSVKGLRIIEERSDGLVDFVKKFRSLTMLPKLKISKFSVTELFKNTELLLLTEIKTNNIKYTYKVFPQNLELQADKKLVEQMLINLIKNSIHALEGRKDKQLTINSFIKNDKRTAIEIIDNGKGMSEEIKDKIFIPFFTTKENGSGIGLSISRQIMKLHGGSFSVHSVEEIETIFTLNF